MTQLTDPDTMPASAGWPEEPDESRQVAGGARRGRVARLIGTHGALIAVAIAFVVPVLAMVSTSFKTPGQLAELHPSWLPDPVHASNYADAVSIPPILQMFSNTVTIVVLQVIGATLSSAVIGYGFARIRWRGRNVVFILVIATMLIPYEVMLIPQYILFGKLGWLNTFYPLIVPFFFGHPLYIFLFRQFFLGIPEDFAEAARIDGASELRIFGRIYLPLARSAVTVVALLQFVAGWNQFLEPLIYLNDRNLSTLVLGMEYFRQTQYQVNVAGQAAYSILIVLPVVIVFFLAQRRFIEGVTLTAVKG